MTNIYSVGFVFLPTIAIIILVHEYVFLNNEIIAAKDAEIKVLSAALLYGKGVFTTIAIYSGQHFFWEKHWSRLEQNAKKLNINLSEFTEHQIKNGLAEIIQKNGVSGGRARITFFEESASEIWSVATTERTSFLILTGDLRPISDNFRITVSPYIVNSLSALAGIKSCNYLEKILTLDEAKGQGFDEAIEVNEHGKITSATMANVFWLKGDLLYTPSLKTGCLPGTTREFVMENLDCGEVEVMLDELDSAKAIFLTSAGLGAVQVAEFESKRFEKIAHPILELLPKQI